MSTSQSPTTRRVKLRGRLRSLGLLNSSVVHEAATKAYAAAGLASTLLPQRTFVWGPSKPVACHETAEQQTVRYRYMPAGDSRMPKI